MTSFQCSRHLHLILQVAPAVENILAGVDTLRWKATTKPKAGKEIRSICEAPDGEAALAQSVSGMAIFCT